MQTLANGIKTDKESAAFTVTDNLKFAKIQANGITTAMDDKCVE